jgi:hypothetical protein
MSVMVQSRGNVPVPNWIFAKLLHTRRSLLRRFANVSISNLHWVRLWLIWLWFGFSEEILETT